MSLSRRSQVAMWALCVFLLLLAVGAARHAYISAILTSTLGNGRHIYSDMLGAEMDAKRWKTSVLLPPLETAETSTEYFELLKYPVFSSTHSSVFASVNDAARVSSDSLEARFNAWCVNPSALTNANSQVPFLFTRNLRFVEEGGRVTATLSGTLPFAKHAAVIIYSGGSAVKMRLKELNALCESLRPEDVQHALYP